MREFLKNGKANFVDEKDVLVGFDNSQDCCEQFGWFYSETVPEAVQDGKPPANLEAYIFDPTFFQEVTNSQLECSIAVFKLVSGDKTVFLCLHNSHNGYYSHGFKLEVGGTVIREGSL